MRPHECEIDGWWRVTKVAPDQQFKVEQHIKGVGWATIMNPAILRDDDTLYHDNSLSEEVIDSVEIAIGSYLENESRLVGLLPQCDTERYFDQRVVEALELIECFGSIDGDHHKQWVLDQVVRKLTGDKYEEFRAGFIQADGDDTYDSYEEGIAP